MVEKIDEKAVRRRTGIQGWPTTLKLGILGLYALLVVVIPIVMSLTLGSGSVAPKTTPTLEPTRTPFLAETLIHTPSPAPTLALFAQVITSAGCPLAGSGTE